MAHGHHVLKVTVVFAALAIPDCSGFFSYLPTLPRKKDEGWNALKVKYTPFFNGLFNIPLTTKDIGKEFVLLKAHEEFDKAAIYCYPDDPRVCPIYDEKGNIAGIRVGYVINDLQNRLKNGETFPYSYDNKPIFKKGTAYGLDIYYIDVLFISPDSLRAGGPNRRTEKVGTGLYLNMDGKTWVEMPRQEKDVETTTEFTKQACFVGMGMHYFYKMTPALKCEDHQPPFLLYDKGELIGFGLIPFGTFSKKKREWFEDPNEYVVRMIVPNRPQCLTEFVKKYGTSSMHFFFKDCTRLMCIPFIR